MHEGDPERPGRQTMRAPTKKGPQKAPGSRGKASAKDAGTQRPETANSLLPEAVSGDQPNSEVPNAPGPAEKPEIKRRLYCNECLRVAQTPKGDVSRCNLEFSTG